MNINGFKGTFYDLFGYFAPGLIAVIGCLITMVRVGNICFTIDSLKTASKNISALEVLGLIIIAYILGHAIASISSLLIEKNLVVKFKKLRESIGSNNILNDEHYTILCAKYKNVFSAQYNDENIRRIICYVQSKQNLVYETALIFLSFYGMARNFAFTFGAFLVIELVLCIIKQGSIYALILLALLSIVFLYEYIRFKKYFIDTILSGFLIPEK